VCGMGWLVERWGVEGSCDFVDLSELSEVVWVVKEDRGQDGDVASEDSTAARGPVSQERAAVKGARSRDQVTGGW
jgi:hypothetical protein